MRPYFDEGGPHRYTGGILFDTPVRSSRFVANLADTESGWAVSVREVANIPRNGSPILLYSILPPSVQFPEIDDLRLRLQVLRPSGAEEGQLLDFADRVTAEDDTGRRLTAVLPEGAVSFSGGVARLVKLSAPAPEARFLRYVQGRLFITPAGGQGRPVVRPFRIANVPLPACNHVFGVAGAAYINSSSLALAEGNAGRFHDGVRLLGHATAVRLADHFPPRVSEPGPIGQPPRLILHPGAPYEFRLYLSRGSTAGAAQPLEVGLTAHMEAGGEIPVRLRVHTKGGRELRIDARLWNEEPTIVAIPASRLLARAGAGDIIAIRLLLYLDPNRPELAEIVPPGPFPVSRGGRGGTIEGCVQIGGEPLAWGHAIIEVMPLRTGNRPPGPAEQSIALGPDGAYRFINMAPGVYRLRIIEAWHYLSAAVRELPWTEYLRRRFSISHAVWDPDVQEITVRPGGISVAAPWRAVEERAAVRVSAGGLSYAAPAARRAAPIARISRRAFRG